MMDHAEAREIAKGAGMGLEFCPDGELVPGLNELQQEAVREIVQELLTEANRKLVEQLRRPLIPT